MKRREVFKRCIAFMAVIGMILSVLPFAGVHKAYAANPTTVYFYNSDLWTTVGVHGYKDGGSLTGDWGTTTATAATALGDNWYKADIPAEPGFNVIFFDKDGDPDANRINQYFADGTTVYSTLSGLYGTVEDAEEAMSDPVTTVYYLNTGDFNVTNAYVYDASGTVGTAYPGAAVEASAATGENWVKFDVSANLALKPVTVIFNDGTDENQISVYLADKSKLYTTKNGEAYATVNAAETSVGIIKETVVYFLNNKDWANVGCYTYGPETFGGWPGVTPDAATELGEKWMKVTVTAEPPFSIIFFDKDNDADRTEIQLTDKNMVYVTGSNSVFSTKLAAELDTGLADPSLMTTVYFYNSRDWRYVNAYTFTKETDDENAAGITLGTGWPGKEAVSAAAELGEGWWKTTVPMDASVAGEEFYVVFNDAVNTTPDVKITDKSKIYVIPTGAAYADKSAAVQAAANAVYEEGCEEGVNKDIASYQVTYNGEGAALPYVTYEAENGTYHGTHLEKDTTYSTAIQSEASQREAVKLDTTGDYSEITLTEAANSIVVRYCIPDSADGTGMDASLNMYINGTKVDAVNMTSKYSWVYGGYPYYNDVTMGTPHRFFDEVRLLLDKTYPAGTKIRLAKDAENTAQYYIIDFVEAENVAAPLSQPAGSLSIEDFGATADDGTDDYDAIMDTIEAAQEQGKEVWIPAGTYTLSELKALDTFAVTVRGAGMWYSVLEGAGAAFKITGTCKFYDFAITGAAVVRRDSIDLAAFEFDGRSTNTTIQNIWIEHVKVGVWSANVDSLVIQGCRIRNTFADGINLCSLSNNCIVRNNNIRNTGDDCMAIWPWNADCSNNTITHNTIQIPMLANGVAIYAGSGNVVEYNNVKDIVNNGSGICIGSQFDTKEPFHGTTTVRNNLLERCGSMQTDSHYPIGAVWIWATKYPMEAKFVITDNKIMNSSYEGFLIDGGNKATEVIFMNNLIDGATDAMYIRGSAKGSGRYYNVTAKNITGKMLVNENSNFTFVEDSSLGNSGEGGSGSGTTGGSTGGSTAGDGNEKGDVGTADPFTGTIIILFAALLTSAVVFYRKKSQKTA